MSRTKRGTTACHPIFAIVLNSLFFSLGLNFHKLHFIACNNVLCNQIAKLDTSGVSMMPPGLTNGLRRDELLDLLHYLMHLK